MMSGEGAMKFLEVLVVHNGTREAQAAAAFKLVEEWNLTNCLQCMSFDSNTRLVSGACALLENKLKRELLSLACRCHEITFPPVLTGPGDKILLSKMIYH